MVPSRSIFPLLTVTLIATVGAVAWIAVSRNGNGGMTETGGVGAASNLEASLGLQAARTGDLGRPRSLHSATGNAERRNAGRSAPEGRDRNRKAPRHRDPGVYRDDSERHITGAHRRESASRVAVQRSKRGGGVGAYPVIRIRSGETIPIRARPGGGAVGVAAGKTEFGSPTVFGVVRTSGRWVGVTTPDLPNDRLGWMRIDRPEVTTSWTERSIHVDLTQRRATLRDSGEPVYSFEVTIGAPGTATPTGRFSVTDTFRGGLNPVYGCCAIALTAIQPDLPPGWPGGNRIAIHGNGTGGPLGAALSNGCLRATNEDVDVLVDAVDLGTPVFIRR